jgi:hypothetical protein
MAPQETMLDPFWTAARRFTVSIYSSTSKKQGTAGRHAEWSQNNLMAHRQMIRHPKTGGN